MGRSDRSLEQPCDTLFADNHARGGGAISALDAPILVERSRFERNHADDPAPGGQQGGAIYSRGDGPVTVIDSTFLDGSALLFGGAIATPYSALTVSGSTFIGKSAPQGGAISNRSDALVRITNSTFDGNTTGTVSGNVGGTIELGDGSGDADLVHVTVTNNEGHGVRAWTTPTFLVGSVIAGNSAGDCAGPIELGSYGGNIASDDSCDLTEPTDQPDTDPQLAPLGDNGGLTLTRLPLPGSPAIDAALAAGCPAVDQRGEVRPVDGDEDGVAACDARAVEVQAEAPLPTDPGTTPNTPNTPGTPPAAQPVTADPRYTG